jgi:hypothetical protein
LHIAKEVVLLLCDTEIRGRQGDKNRIRLKVMRMGKSKIVEISDPKS